MVDFQILQWDTDGAALLAGIENNSILAALAADSSPKNMLGTINLSLPYRMGMAGIAVHFQNIFIDHRHIIIRR